MKTEELIIGNKVLFAEDGTEFEVTGIFKDGLNVKNETEETYIEIDAFEGILLTEEWLVKFGFEKIHDRLFILNGFELTFQTIDGIVSWFFDWKYKSFKSVHQLQNLYFSLTGGELTPKS